MIKKFMTFAIALGLLAGVLTGCGKPTVEDLVDGMYDSGIESRTAEVEMDVELKFASQGMGFYVSVGGDFDVQTSGRNGEDAQISYTDGDISVKVPIGNIDENLGVIVYSIVDDGTVTAYAYHEDEDLWYKVEMEPGGDGLDQDTIDEITGAMRDVLKENGELAEDTQDVEGEECYVLTASIEGDDWSTVLHPLQDVIDDEMKNIGIYFEVDVLSCFEYLSADMTYYISKKTGSLVKVEGDMSATDLYGILNDMVEQILENIGGENGLSNPMDMFEEASFSKFYFSAVFSDINDTEVEIPDDVPDDAIEIKMDDVIDDAIDDSIEMDDDDDIMDGIGGGTVGYHDGYVTINMCSESDTFLCDVKLPEGYTYDEGLSAPEEGYVYLFDYNEGGCLIIQNRVLEPLYDYLLYGSVPDDPAYSGYTCETEVIGTVLDTDCILVHETYDNENYDYSVDNIYCIMEYSDGGLPEFVTVASELRIEDTYTNEDWLNLMKELFD